MEILLLSAYHAPSHRRWVDGLVENLPHHRFRVLTQPPRHFAWRSRGNSLYWAFDQTLREARPDLIVATSMVALASLRGMVPHLTGIPTLVYFHENQFAYPSRRDRDDGNYGVTNLYTALAADRVLFNSPYNRQSFLEGIDEFLARMPDQVPEGVARCVADGSAVVPVPLEDSLFDDRQQSSNEEPIRLVWNHRWEFDKAPERFFAALESLTERFDFRLVVMGQQFRRSPRIFDEMRSRLDDHVDQWGWVDDRAEYIGWLDRSDVVVSTALHEFQGLAVQEAVVRGCLPVLPDRLAYADFFDETSLYESNRDDPEAEASHLANHLARLLADPGATRRRKKPDLSRLRWSNLGRRYDEEFHTTAGSQPVP